MCEGTRKLVAIGMDKTKPLVLLKAIRRLFLRKDLTIEEAMEVLDIPKKDRKDWASCAKKGRITLLEETEQYETSGRVIGKIESNAKVVYKMIKKLGIPIEEAIEILDIPVYEQDTCVALLEHMNKNGNKVEVGLLCDALIDTMERYDTNLDDAMDRLNVHHGARFACIQILKDELLAI